MSRERDSKLLMPTKHTWSYKAKLSNIQRGHHTDGVTITIYMLLLGSVPIPRFVWSHILSRLPKSLSDETININCGPPMCIHLHVKDYIHTL